MANPEDVERYADAIMLAGMPPGTPDAVDLRDAVSEEIGRRAWPDSVDSGVPWQGRPLIMGALADVARVGPAATGGGAEHRDAALVPGTRRLMLRTVAGQRASRGLGVDRFVDRRAR